MFLEQGDDPSIGQESMVKVLQPVQHSYQPANNVFLPPGPNTMGIPAAPATWNECASHGSGLTCAFRARRASRKCYICEHSMVFRTENWQILKTLGSLNETLNLSLMTRRSGHAFYAYYGTMHYEPTSPKVHPGLPWDGFISQFFVSVDT